MPKAKKISPADEQFWKTLIVAFQKSPGCTVLSRSAVNSWAEIIVEYEPKHRTSVRLKTMKPRGRAAHREVRIVYFDATLGNDFMRHAISVRLPIQIEKYDRAMLKGELEKKRKKAPRALEVTLLAPMHMQPSRVLEDVLDVIDVLGGKIAEE